MNHVIQSTHTCVCLEEAAQNSVDENNMKVPGFFNNPFLGTPIVLYALGKGNVTVNDRT
jgi:hypothetical protein